VEKDGAALLVLCFVLVVAMLGVLLYVSGSSRRAELTARGRGGDEEQGMARLRHTIDSALRRSGPGRRLANWLAGAGSPLSPGDFILLCVAASVPAWLLLSLFTTRFIALLVTLALTVGVSRALVERKRRARREEFIAQLPDVARVLSNGTSAGLSLAGAVQLAARELKDPAAAEMRMVVQETRLGLAMEESLERLRERLPSREVAVLMTTLIIQQRAGGDTVRALSELGATLEARKDLNREIRTMLSGAVFASYLVMVIGLGTLVLINIISPGVLREMSGSLLGILALSATAILYAVAFLAVRQITKVET